VVLPVLAVALLWFTLAGNGLLRLRRCIPVVVLVIPLGIYLMLRANALTPAAVPSATEAPAAAQVSELPQAAVAAPGPAEAAQAAVTAQAEAPPPSAAGAPAAAEESMAQPADRMGKLAAVFAVINNYNLERLLKAVRIGADALNIMIWPHPLLLYHGEPATSLKLALALQLVLLAGAVGLFIYYRPGLIIGLSFFYIALLPSTGILLADRVELAERFLYLPSAGLAIAFAFGLRWLAQRFNPLVVTIAIAVLTLVLMPVTWARNADWASTVRLAEADYQKGVRDNLILRALVQHNLEAGNFSRAAEVCDQQPEVKRISKSLNNFCGAAYERVGRYDDAEKTFLMALSSRQRTPMLRFALASMYLRQGRRSDAEKYFNQGIAKTKVPSHKELLIGFMLTELYPHDRVKLLEAKAHFERALELQPQLFEARQMLKEVDEKLATGKNVFN